MLLSLFLLTNMNLVIFMLMGISMCNELREKVYPRIIRNSRTKRESSLSPKLEVRFLKTIFKDLISFFI